MADFNDIFSKLGISTKVKPEAMTSSYDNMSDDEKEYLRLKEEDPSALTPAVDPTENAINQEIAARTKAPVIAEQPIPEESDFATPNRDLNLEQEIQSAATDSGIDLSGKPDAPKGPSYYEDILNAYRSLPGAQKDYQNNVGNLDMLAGANKIAQGLAMGSGGKIDDGSELVAGLKKSAGIPVDQIKQKLDMAGESMKMGSMAEMVDPKSDVSKYTREQAYALLKKLNPDVDYSGKLDNMSAEQLQKLPGMKTALGSSGSQKTQQSQYIEKSSGDPLNYDPFSPTPYTNAITGKPVASGNVVRPVAYADAFGNRQFVGPTGNVTVQSSRRDKVSSEELAKQAENFTPDKEQRQAFDKEKTRIDGLTKNINEKVSAASRILGALDGDSKQAIAVIKTQMPRLSGEVGNLNQSEQEVWSGSQSWLDKAQQYLATGSSSELTPDNKEELRKILGTFLTDAVQSRDSVMTASADSLAQVYNIPQDFTKKAYGVVKPVSKRQEDVMAGQVGEPTGKKAIKSGYVRFVDSKGREHDMPKDNLKIAKERDPGLKIIGGE